MTPEELKSIREKLGLRRRELARKLGVSRSTVWRWEAGVHPIEPVSERLVLILATAPPEADSEAKDDDEG